MPKYPIPNAKSKMWGWLETNIELPAGSDKVLGAGLDIAIHGLRLIENQLLSEMVGTRPVVQNLLYLYFNLPLKSPKKKSDEVVAEIKSKYADTRSGLEGEFGSLTIHQNEKGTSKILSGYVPETGIFRKTRGEIHLNFPKIMKSDLYAGGIYWTRLIVHEATHRYAGTGDLVNEVKLNSKDSTDGYLGGDQNNTVAKFNEYVQTGKTPDDAREKTVCPKISKISIVQHLTNADSYAFFFSSMLQAYRDKMDLGIKFKGLYGDLSTAAVAFAEAQKKAVHPEMLEVEGVVRVDKFT